MPKLRIFEKLKNFLALLFTCKASFLLGSDLFEKAKVMKMCSELSILAEFENVEEVLAWQSLFS
jgi:hypothetical protein